MIELYQLRTVQNKDNWILRLSPIKTYHYYSLLKVLDPGDVLMILKSFDVEHKT